MPKNTNRTLAVEASHSTTHVRIGNLIEFISSVCNGVAIMVDVDEYTSVRMNIVFVQDMKTNKRCIYPCGRYAIYSIVTLNIIHVYI